MDGVVQIQPWPGSLCCVLDQDTPTVPFERGELFEVWNREFTGSGTVGNLKLTEETWKSDRLSTTSGFRRFLGSRSRNS